MHKMPTGAQLIKVPDHSKSAAFTCLHFANMSRIKAIFVGINYSKETFGKTMNLNGLPYVYAAWTASNLIQAGIYSSEECLFFTDHTKGSANDLPGVERKKPSKQKITQALRRMVWEAKEEDRLLFYFCGHGSNDSSKSCGAIMTLNANLTGIDCIYSTDLHEIGQGLDAKASITWLVHASNGGAMFSYHTQTMRGGALTAVGPDNAAAVRAQVETVNFTNFLCEKVIKKLSQGALTYGEIFDELRAIKVTGILSNEEEFEDHAHMYYAPGVNPECSKFLQL